MMVSFAKNETMADTKEENPPATSSRHTLWFLASVFTVIALVAIATDFAGMKDQERQVKWSVAGISIALALSILGVIANMLLRKKFTGTAIEGGLCLFTVGMWAAVLPAIMEPGANIATGQFGVISNPNLYFFSWGGFIMSFLVFVGFIMDKNASGVGAIVTDIKWGSWAALTMTSFVAMVAGSRLFNNVDCKSQTGLDGVCRRLTFAVTLGLVSSIVAAVWLVIGSRCFRKCNKKSESVLSILCFVAWVFGVGYITFGDDRPARSLGNLYFFTWGSCAISSGLAGSDLYDLCSRCMPEVGAEEEGKQEAKDKAADEKA